MNKSINLDDWGSFIVDNRGSLIDVSPNFCENFSINKHEWLEAPIDEVIKRTNGRKPKNVIFGFIFGFRCLIKVTEKNQHLLYRVIVREEDIDHYEMVAYMSSIESSRRKKNDIYPNKYSFEQIIGESQALKSIKELAARVATSNSTILLTGESGTGKELFAQAIHGMSTRKNKAFIAVNCAAIPEELFESEVFGYEAGAFSGAKKEGKPGKIELAQHGTLFLDEISELSYHSQGKLLRVLQEREVERLGGTSRKNIDVRIIAATNRDLSKLVEEGKFRQDLFYRLYVFNLIIPSLRQRKEDILLLVKSFINHFNESLGLYVKYIDNNLQEWLLSYEWPGNVRELKAYIERGMNIVNGDTLTMDNMHFFSFESSNPTISDLTPLQSLEEEVRSAEINAIQRSLKEANGDRTLAAQKLKIHIASLYRKIAKYNLK